MIKPSQELTLKNAAILSLLVYAFFSVANVIAKWVMQTYSFWQLQFTSSLIILIIVSIYAIYARGFKRAFYTQHIGWHALRGSLLAGNLILLLFAISRIPLADVYGLMFLNPIWLALLSILFFKEHVPLSRWVAIIVGFLGVVVIAGPHFVHFDVGMLAALSSGFCFALSALIIRRIGKDEPITLFTMATSIFIITFSAPMLPSNFIVPDAAGWFWITAYALTSLVGILGVVTTFSRYPKPSVIAPMQYTQLIWASALAWVLFGEVPGVNIYIGAALVIGAGVAIIRSGKEKKS